MDGLQPLLRYPAIPKLSDRTVICSAVYEACFIETPQTAHLVMHPTDSSPKMCERQALLLVNMTPRESRPWMRCMQSQTSYLKASHVVRVKVISHLTSAPLSSNMIALCCFLYRSSSHSPSTLSGVIDMALWPPNLKSIAIRGPSLAASVVWLRVRAII